ncbi:MAG: ATG3/ATG10 family protein [archaeon]|nr:ATG3/ATG10 family protein [archaeon]
MAGYSYELFQYEAQQLAAASQATHRLDVMWDWHPAESPRDGFLSKRGRCWPHAPSASATAEPPQSQIEEPTADDPAEFVFSRESTAEAPSFECHILFSRTYGVPALYFNGYHSDGTPLGADQVVLGLFANPALLDAESRWSTLTQEEHPTLGTPFFLLHPCRARELLSQLTSGRLSPSVPLLVSWLSIYGPVLGIRDCGISLFRSHAP